MPAEPTSASLARLLRKPPKVERKELPTKGIDPTWLSQGFEGIMDIIRGSLGGGTGNKMNLVGEMLGMAVPVSKTLKGGISRMKGLPAQFTPSPGEYDEAGRLLSLGPSAPSEYLSGVKRIEGPQIDWAEEQFRKATRRNPISAPEGYQQEQFRKAVKR